MYERLNSKEESMNQKIVEMIALGAFALVIVLGERWQAQAQDPKAPYASMAPLEQYLMADRNAEIALARSAAPEAISRDADVLVLGRHGYETAVKGKNGFVCAVERGWMGPFNGEDAANFWNPKIRGPICFNPPAARSILPLTYKRTEMILAGQSKAQIIDGIKTFIKQELPPLEPGAWSHVLHDVQRPVPYRRWRPPLDGSPHVLHATHGRRRLGCRSAPLSRHAKPTVRRRSGTNRRIHDSRGQMVGWNGGPSQVGTATQAGVGWWVSPL
jgi:hypothetical protein